MKLNSFPGIIKFLLKDLPTNDYPVLNSRLFCSIWFTGILDKGINSLRDLFYQLNHAGTKVDLSRFSKANKTRDPQIFMRLYHKGTSINSRLLRMTPGLLIIANERLGASKSAM
jgi:transposase, IS4 family